MHRLRIILTLLLITFALFASVQAATTGADAIVARVAFGPRLEVLEDPQRNMDFDAVRNAADFKPAAPNLGTNFGFTHSAWWVRFKVANTTGEDRHVMLRQDYPLIDYLDVWTPYRNGNWHHVATGDRRAFATREFAHRDFIFGLDVPANTELTFYARGASDGPVDLNFTLYEPPELVATLSREQLAYGVYYGGFLVLVLYNFFIFLIVRDRAFSYYLLYATSYGLYFAIHNGLAFQFLWPNDPAWGNQSLLVMLALSLIFGLQFTRIFLDAARLAPRLDRFAVALQAFAGIGLVASFFAPYGALILSLAILTVVVTILIMVMGTFGLVKGYPPARYFMIAWGMLLVGVLAYMLKVFGLLPHNVLTQNGFQVGSLMEMVLLSLALASRMRDLRLQSLTDALTRVHNRRFFDEYAPLEFARAKRNHASLALLVVDIDHFKQFNDRYGHARGDEVLKMVADHLCHGVRRGDAVCRYGGEEFALILPGASGAEATKVAETLRRTIESHVSVDAPLTISIGAASTNDSDFNNVDEMFRAADGALYRAKGLGRNRVVHFAA